MADDLKRGKRGTWWPIIFGIMFSLRSVKGRSLLAGLALLLLLVGVAALAIWRTQSEQSARSSLEQRAFALSDLESARAQVFLVGTYTALSAFADDPAFFVEQYQQLHKTATQTLREARDKLATTGDKDGVAQIDSFTASVEQLLAEADTVMGAFDGMSKEQRLESARQATTQMWPDAAPLIAEVEQFAQEQEAKLSSERAAADSASERSLALLIGLSALSFLVATGILLTFIFVARSASCFAPGKRQGNHIGRLAGKGKRVRPRGSGLRRARRQRDDTGFA